MEDPPNNKKTTEPTEEEPQKRKAATSSASSSKKRGRASEAPETPAPVPVPVPVPVKSNFYYSLDFGRPVILVAQGRSQAIELLSQHARQLDPAFPADEMVPCVTEWEANEAPDAYELFGGQPYIWKSL